MNAVTRFIGRLQDDGGLKSTDIANFTDVSSATVSRWKAGSHAPDADIQLLLARLHYVVSRLNDYHKSDDVRIWLYSGHPQLDGRRAIDLIVGNRTAEVIAMLDRLDAEAYL